MLIPLRVDVPTWHRPWVNYALIAMTICTSLQGFYDEEFFWKWAGIRITYRWPEPLDSLDSEKLREDLPRGMEWAFRRYHLTTRDFPLSVLAITSSFLHAGWWHLCVNMLFLWVFGNAINYKFGHLGYIVIYLAAALFGGLAHYTYIGAPGVGASGAIYGVMGAFLVFFPRNDVTIFWLIWWRPAVSRLSSGWIILLFIVWNILYLAFGVRTYVGLWCHVMGFATGFLIALLCAVCRLIKPTADEQTLLQLFRRR